MSKPSKKRVKFTEKDPIHTGIREKLGVTQAHLAAVLGVSRSYLTLAESGKRTLHSSTNILLMDIFQQFRELETGELANYRSLETKAFLNHEYKKILPLMKALEKDCRYRLNLLKEQLKTMKQKATDTEHAIIVLTNVVNNLQEKNDPAAERMITGFHLLKQQAYDRLLTCWEPEQAKLHSKIEAVAGEARALRRYRTKVVREQGLKKLKG